MKQENSILKFIKNSGIFFIGSILSKAISILLLPLYTTKIPPSDMGYFDLSLTYITIATSVLFFDIWVAILRFMYDKNDENYKAKIIKSGNNIFLLSSIIYIILGLIICIPLKIQSWYWILLYGLSMNLSNIFTFCARGYKKNFDFAVSGVINTIVNVVLNLVLILSFNVGFEAMYISSIIGFLAQTIYISLRTSILKDLLNTKSDFSMFKQLLKYSLPLCLNSVSFWILSSLNRVVLNYVYGNELNGIYAVGNKFAFIISLATTCFTYAWQDLSFSEVNNKDEKGSFFSKACNMYIKFLCICTCLGLPMLKFIFPILVGEAYMSAESTIPLFLINALTAAVSTFIGNIFYAIKDTKSIFISMLISAIVNVCIGYPLIISLGINGANLAIVISFVVNILIRYVILYKKVSLKFDYRLIFEFLLVMISSIVYTNTNILWNSISFVCVLLISFYIFKEYILAFLKILKKKV